MMAKSLPEKVRHGLLPVEFTGLQHGSSCSYEMINCAIEDPIEETSWKWLLEFGVPSYRILYELQVQNRFTVLFLLYQNTWVLESEGGMRKKGNMVHCVNQHGITDHSWFLLWSNDQGTVMNRIWGCLTKRFGEDVKKIISEDAQSMRTFTAYVNHSHKAPSVGGCLLQRIPNITKDVHKNITKTWIPITQIKKENLTSTI